MGSDLPDYAWYIEEVPFNRKRFTRDMFSSRFDPVA
jgi:hypothetical protein